MPLHSRKFLLALATLAIGGGLAAFSLLDTATAGFLTAIYTTYCGINMAGKSRQEP